MHNIKKSILTISIFSFLLCFGTLFAQSNVIDEVIAVVGDNAILKSDIEYQYQQALMQGMSSANGDLKCELFEQQLVQKLMLNQAVLDSIEVSENQVINEVDRRMKDFVQRAGGEEKLEEYFKKSMMEIKRDQLKTIREQSLTQQMQQAIVEGIDPTPAQVRSFIRKTSKDSLPMVPVQYEILKLSVYPRIEQKEIDRVKEKLRDFQKQVAEGRDFATLAVLYSEDPSATTGGDLGWATKGSYVPEFANVAFNMQEKNKVSKIVETEYGYHIIQLLDRKGERIHLRHILMKPKVSAVAKQNAIARLDSLRNLIKDNTLSFEDVALRYSEDKDTRNNGGVMVNPRTQSTKFELSTIDQPALAKKLQSLSHEELSKPFAIKDNKGKDVFVVIKQKSKIEPHRANIKDDYQLVYDIMVAKHRGEGVEEWIKEKQQETYVTIKDEWVKCEFKYENWIKH
ncbi:peptidylprolyl isomerase [bacterium]|nr:peptidylprolyl isomerase [bacterium]